MRRGLTLASTLASSSLSAASDGAVVLCDAMDETPLAGLEPPPLPPPLTTIIGFGLDSASPDSSSCGGGGGGLPTNRELLSASAA